MARDIKIEFRDIPEIRDALQSAAGPYGDRSKVARVAIRKGLREMGYWPIVKENVATEGRGG